MAEVPKPRTKAWKAERERLAARKKPARRCTKCLKIKTLNPSFYKQKDGPDGYQAMCKECDKAYQKKWLATSKSPSATKARKGGKGAKKKK